MDINEIRIANLKQIILKDYGNSIQKFATTVGRHNSHFYSIFSGRRSFGQNLARQLEETLNIAPYSLDQSEEVKSLFDSVLFVPAYGVDEHSADFSDTLTKVSNDIFVIEKAKIKNSNWQVNKLYGLIMDDESMQPTIKDGSKIIIDSSQTTLKDGKIYALSKNNEIFIRRVSRQLGGTGYIAQCDNEKYGKVEFKDGKDITVIGRVVYLLGQEI
ncbi:MAG: hypothetical protein K0R14_1266 [Burkholderiales bacterium]|jgi:hypothetical protein|nr:hypothetical protein [Burkholderiales bacterium]